jgi:hypothetical protein
MSAYCTEDRDLAEIFIWTVAWKLPSQIIDKLNGWRRINKKKAPQLAGLSKSRKCWYQSQARESSDNPMLNAFCRVAPSVRFRVRAILPAVAFLRASRFISRTSLAVQARRFLPFLISISFNEADAFSWKSP